MKSGARFSRALFSAAILSTVVCLQGCVGAVLLGAGAATATVATDRRTLGAQLDDKAIAAKASSAIGNAEGLTEKVHINITSMNGVALLSGEAPTAEARDKVLAAVRTVSGVRRIVNEIRIAPLSTSSARATDSGITLKVKAKLVGVQDLDSSQVKVVTENASVYLMGLVKKTEGDAAANATAEVSGVERVVKLFEYID